MKIIIASTIVPFIKGGGTFIYEWTAKKLIEAGHEVEIFAIPFNHRYDTLLEQMVTFQGFDLSKSCDRLISIRTPSYMLNHPNHVCWFIHHYRLTYELWGTSFQQEIPLTPEGYQFKDAVVNADNIALRKLKKIFTNSKEITNRLKEYNDLDSEVLYPPLLDQDDFYCNKYDDYIYYSSRISLNKRQDLAIKAMKYTKSNVKLLITGFPDTPHSGSILQKLIEDNNLHDKVIYKPEWISNEEKVHNFADCLAGIYIPFDEDSYGYPSLEAFASKKAVITCTDSGGTDELIEDNHNGYMVKPYPELIAEKMDQLYRDKQLAKKLGENAYKTLIDKQILWDHVIDSFTKEY